TGRNGRHPLPDPQVLSDTFGRLGIVHGTQVVAYDQDAGSFASRLWWLLRWLGHDAVAVLDGGFAKWAAEAQPVSAGEERRGLRGGKLYPGSWSEWSSDPSRPMERSKTKSG